jgi:preprotein translocase subunit SecA
MKGLEEKLIGQFGLSLKRRHQAAGTQPHELGEAIFEKLKQDTRPRRRFSAQRTMRYHERMVMLSVIDGLWKDHLLAMDHLKEGIGLRGYAQQDPLVAYKRESFDMFEAMMLKFQEDTVRFLFRMQILGPDGQPVNAAPEPRRAGSAGAAGGQRAQAAHAGGRAAAAGDSIPTRQPHDHRRAGEGVPAQEAAGAGGGQHGRAPETRASPRSAAPAKKWAATTHAPAAAARSTRSATGLRADSEQRTVHSEQ